MHAHFGTVVVVVLIVAVVLAAVGMASSNSPWSDYGKGGMVKDRDAPREPRTRVSPAAERETDIRSMLEARNARRVRRGEPPLDVDAELARLTAPRARARTGAAPTAGRRDIRPDARAGIGADVPDLRPAPRDTTAAGAPETHPEDRTAAGAPDTSDIDPALRDEVRQLVVARNHRRVRAGKPALDVETEIERELRRVRDL